MTISLDSVYDKMTQSVSTSESELDAFMNTMDPDNPADMLKLQQLMTKWSNLMNLSTNMMNTIKDATKGVVTNMR